ncbi:GH36-type glycosyl hydrolase domain-containing protein [Tianweitania populi]|uniref:Protein ndvB n=1 Tax=Tianweitania populi TaxID=1607949 RepID=A0A8J3DUH8_9HYPH|nr:glucoamylase family protein [Tianweitania populi]GHD11235.1 protein ndvB [Tianweitania populi]
MDVQTDSSRLKFSDVALPAAADLPIRSNFIREENLRSLGAEFANNSESFLRDIKPFDVQERLKDNAAKILGVYRATNDAVARGDTITPAAQWLLDNNHVVEEAIHQVRRDLPHRFYRELPLIRIGGGHEIPRALALAWLYVAHTDSAVSESSFQALVHGFQTVHPLKIGELWALPSILRFVLIENLRRLALRVDRAREMRQVANVVADRILGSGSVRAGEEALKPLARHAQDNTFATQLLYRLRDGSRNAGEALRWLETELEKAGNDAEVVIHGEHQTLSSGNVTTGNIIRSLRLVDDVEWSDWFEALSYVDEELRKTPHFAELDFASRNEYRKAIEKLARRSGKTEVEVARLTLAHAAVDGDAGVVLVGSGREAFERELGYNPTFSQRFRRIWRRAGWMAVAGPVAILTGLLLLAAGLGLWALGATPAAMTILLILFSIPAIEGAVGLYNTLTLLFLTPTRMIGYEYKEGVPAEARTLVVIPSLIGSRDDVDESVRNLEVHFLANMKGELSFALLTDWNDSKHEISPEDQDLLDYARSEIRVLNERYPRDTNVRFHILHRRRLWNKAEGVWMGWERKRGKLHELNLLLRGDDDTTFLTPDTALPEGVVYVMTLDADTRMTREAATRLVGKMQHPLNRPVNDPKTGIVIRGAAILQPRVTPSLTTGDEASFFQRVFSANRGLDPYVFAVSDVYQDVFGSGTFTGKGLYHIDAVEAAWKGRIAENSVLSHDLLEGSLAGAQLATDVELIEDYPTRYTTDASRHHRWARGDWQLLPYLFDPKSGIPGLSRWKMVDNLRRTITPIFWVLASIAGWSLLPFTFAVQWQALLIISLFLAQTFELMDSLFPRSFDVTMRGHVSGVLRDIAFATAHVVLKVVLIAHSAWLMGDAIIRTLYRMFVSRRDLLEWRTASQASKGGNDLLGTFSTMHGALVIAVVGVAIPTIANSSGAFLGALFALFWIGSPAFAWLISRSAHSEDRLEVSAEDKLSLRVVARRTWLYFETFVTPGEHFLPPDNFQENPVGIVAHRTSPTNIGVYLLSSISARDFGWISLIETAERIDQTVATMEKMQRFRGHLYNWYDTQSLQPLLPLYVSAVDSGNLAGHLIAVARACSDWAEAPAAYLQGDFDGVLDVTTILDETLAALPDDRRPLRPLRQRLSDRITGMRRAVATLQSEPETASIRTINLAVLAGEIRKLAGSIHAEVQSTASEELQLWAAKLAQTCEAHVSDAHTDEAGVAALRERFRTLHDRARLLAFEMDFSFLFREDRKLLSIGYRADTHQLDESCYDLLASEARLTSLFAIAKGDLPTEHWFRLGRPVTEIGFRGALVSWSGSMFEYLMPPLVMKEPQGGLLNQTNNLIIRRQISYARSKGIPWGISEAAFNARDREMTYQYTNFGVPGLGLKRGLANNTVIAPYASVLASQFMPHEAVTNLHRLAELGARGRYGFYDAVDFTPSRVPEGSDHAVVQNYMAHHTGMSIVAVANVVFEGRMRDHFHSDPVIVAAELLLQEKAPRAVPVTIVRTEAAEQPATGGEELSPDTRLIENPLAGVVSTNLISNGHFFVMTTATGTGYSRFNDLAVTRWTGDASEDRSGSFLFVRDCDDGAWWSATAEPKRVEGEETRVIFANDKSVFSKRVGHILTEVEVIAVTEGDGEARRITVYNEGASERTIEITSFGEIVLAPEMADSAHPAFSKMFVETEIDPANGAIFATRRKRSPGEPDIALAHFVTTDAGGLRETEAETDRRAFIGRGRTIADPAALDPNAQLTGSAGFTLDPVMALRARVRVPAMKKAALTFWTVVGSNRQALQEAIDRLDHPESFSRQSMLGWTHSQVQTRHVGLTLAEAANVQRLARYLLFPSPVTRTPPDSISAGMGAQSALWSLAISGDFPIFVLRISDQADLGIIAKAMRVQEYLRSRGLTADLVIINEQASSYAQDLQQAIEWHRENGSMRGHDLGPRQHIFSVRRDLMDEGTYRTLLATARVVLHARHGTIADQIERAEIAELELLQANGTGEKPTAKQPIHRTAASSTEASRSSVALTHTPPATLQKRASGQGLESWNGFGGFDRDGRDYVVRLDGRRSTPQPWINVIANKDFGFHVSAEGSAFTWSRNSRDFQLTPWSNDAVSNRPGEAIYIHDLADGTTFSPVAGVVRNEHAVYEARHGQGFSTFTARHGAVETELTHVVDPADSVRLSRLALHNKGDAAVTLRVYAYAEWVLGQNRARNAPNIVSWQEPATGALLARNPFSLDFGERCAFLASDAPAQSVTVDRAEFLGRHGSVLAPEAAITGKALSNKVEAGIDPCSVIARDVTIAPGESAEILYLMGDAGSPDEARDLYTRHVAVDFDERLNAIDAEWNRFLGTLQVNTPDPAMNAMVNAWLPYQAIACRLRARSAFYQASGAYGFRDQLQDTLAFQLHDPSLAQAQVLSAAGRQFPEGDVQHWWLPRSGAGVRTTISDGVVWLAYGAHSAITASGDASILDQEIPFIEGELLKEGEHDAFFTPKTSETTATLYEHCALGLDLAIKRTGADGLPLILGGDWNDGMNGVGKNGAGQSVWLGWFLAKTLTDFVPYARQRGDATRVEAWEAHIASLKTALETAAWDGEWYRRATYDDGTPLGSKDSDECRIDSIAQSWSVLSGIGQPDRQQMAMDQVERQLIDDKLEIVKLFTPAFSKTPKEPGYIKSYPPGVRENGGQYTHAATWTVFALAELGRADAAYRAFQMLMPVNHALDEAAAERYRVEPYVVAADIYSSDDKGGRGGWTWYTGSAGWLYRAAVEAILGIRREGDRIFIQPVLPSSWNGFEATLQLDEATYEIKVQCGEKYEISVNDTVLNNTFMQHSGAGVHEVRVIVPHSIP